MSDGKAGNGIAHSSRSTPAFTRRLADGTSGGQDVRWKASLVENVRVNGKPQQHHIAFLGGIAESGMAIVHQRRYFWDKVYERLDRLANRISLEQRRQIEAAIAARVPRLSQEEHEASVAQCRLTWPDGDHKPFRPPA
jgi:hypothetical protein